MGEKHVNVICMDHSATTYTRPDVVQSMIPYFTEHFGNPSSIYGIARDSKKAVDVARDQVAKALEGLPSIKMHCSVHAEEGIHKAINDYRKKQGLPS
jgi:cysteine sulfinate desulfinase/cysteine desulfurase-like protein